MDFQPFDRYVDQNTAELLGRLEAQCRIPSVSADKGPAMAEAADFILDLCFATGLATEVVPQPAGPPLLIAQGGVGPRCLMIYNQYDASFTRRTKAYAWPTTWRRSVSWGGCWQNSLGCSALQRRISARCGSPR